MRCRKTTIFLCLVLVIFSLQLIRNIFDEELHVIVEESNVLTELNDEAICILPKLEVPQKTYHSGKKLIACESEKCMYIVKQKLQISDECLEKYGTMKCTYAPFERVDDFHTIIRPFTPIEQEFKIPHDFFLLKCTTKENRQFHDIISTIRYEASLHERHLKHPLHKNALGYNVLMFGFDSVSRIAWMSELPKTYDYMKNTLDMQIFEGYNIVGDGTPAAFLPILTGITEMELPEVRRGFSHSTVDDFPWIWKLYKNYGYVTQWGEDMAKIGTFQYRLNGFRHPPVDHYLRPFYLYIEKLYHALKPYCLVTVSRHVNMLNWILSFFETYEDPKPKFSCLFHSELSHDNHDIFYEVDEDLKNFLETLTRRGYLNNTVLILFSDHGTRYGPKRMTYTGKLEERLPMLAIRMPNDFKQNFKIAAKNLKDNTRKLITPFDLHETLLHILNFSDDFQSSRKGKYSLFSEIPDHRLCRDAEIDPHWCTCLRSKDVQLMPSLQQKIIESLRIFLNSLLRGHENECQPLKIKTIIQTQQLYPEETLLKFIKSRDYHGRIPEFSKHPLQLGYDYYRVKFEVEPGGGIFDITLNHSMINDEHILSTSISDISRLNAYENQSLCVSKTYPHLNRFCVCYET